ncbi:MAG: hypothetical protein HN737_05780 [Desulfobacterales bacterium]|jgi:hypothetical protein|nr:hypothetical protein [Desulfobacteraceae bacterium]MBT4364764.1 hypothetical protein [Desulfobacteraceae bacterium]MBT7085934.1 hypothetical protein [Desulfobacterales bacterium]MBT7696900.1 hypothetical protein [Desulfobacterales bacterium]
MKTFDGDNEKIEKVLVTAFREHEKSSVDGLTDKVWQQNVMSSIRKIGLHKTEKEFTVLLGQFFWRLAPVACILIIIMTYFMYNFGFSVEYELSEAFLNQPAEYNLLQTFIL